MLLFIDEIIVTGSVVWFESLQHADCGSEDKGRDSK